MHSNSVLLLLMLAVAACVALPGDATACGPSFPNTILDNDEALTRMPSGDFRRMVLAIPLKERPTCKAVSLGWGGRPSEMTAGVAIDDFTQAIAKLDFDAAKRGQIIADYVRVRKHVNTLRVNAGRDIPAVIARSLLEAFPEMGRWPVEFQLYSDAAARYHMKAIKAARDRWQQLLDLPAEQRHWRSTWAAFMLAETAETPAERIAAYQRVRELADAGFADNLGLAATSLGDEAAVEMHENGDYVRAIHLYVMQVHTGEYFAIPSLDRVVEDVLYGSRAKLPALLKDPVGRDVIMASLVGGGEWYAPGVGYHPQALVADAMEKAGLTDVAHAERLAWAAYRAGDFTAAKRWLARAHDGPVTRWLKVKLLLRDGKEAQAAELLATVVAGFDDDETWPVAGWRDGTGYPDEDRMSPRARVAGELASLKLAKQDYVDAMDLLLRNGWWIDAAYVAERVLQTAELATYVGQRWPRPLKTDLPEDDIARTERQEQAMLTRRVRYLLARRLMREGQWEKALDYFPDASLPHVVNYARAMHLARKAHDDPPGRAGHLLDAAKLLRSYGMALMGTEVAPDWSMYRGRWSPRGIKADRLDRMPADDSDSKLASPSAEEAQRAETNRAYPDKRFHYRHKAADLAWEAAEALPDGDERTAEALWVGGEALRRWDAQRARTFYRAILDRCGQTSKVAAARKRLNELH